MISGPCAKQLHSPVAVGGQAAMSEYGPLPSSRLPLPSGWSQVDQSPATWRLGLRELAAPPGRQDHKHTIIDKCVFVWETDLAFEDELEKFDLFTLEIKRLLLASEAFF